MTPTAHIFIGCPASGKTHQLNLLSRGKKPILKLKPTETFKLHKIPNVIIIQDLAIEALAHKCYTNIGPYDVLTPKEKILIKSQKKFYKKTTKPSLSPVYSYQIKLQNSWLLTIKRLEKCLEIIHKKTKDLPTIVIDSSPVCDCAYLSHAYDLGHLTDEQYKSLFQVRLDILEHLYVLLDKKYHYTVEETWCLTNYENLVKRQVKRAREGEDLDVLRLTDMQKSIHRQLKFAVVKYSLMPRAQHHIHTSFTFLNTTTDRTVKLDSDNSSANFEMKKLLEEHLSLADRWWNGPLSKNAPKLLPIHNDGRPAGARKWSSSSLPDVDEEDKKTE